MIDLEKRRRIMGRSVKLGHCICNPKQPCPCDLFKAKNVCLCAGERLEDAEENVPLTRFVENAGCASKISQNDLKKVLAGLPQPEDPRVLVSSATCDDAGVFKLTEKVALVQSVDVFTPNVDDPYLFGQIAAANSVSDIYAMGGTPLTALSVIAFPIETLSPAIMHRILRGGLDKLAEAGVAVLGGHSLKDDEIKFGFAVTGVVHPGRIVTNAGARPGDALVLTKPLGTGVLSFAAQVGKALPQASAAAGRSMARLNKSAAEIMADFGAVAATDVTGFGLLGHLAEMAAQSGVTAEIYADKVPVFEGVLDCLEAGVVSGAVERNREFASRFVKFGPDIGEAVENLLYDPQTSGGLLIAVAADKAGNLVKKLKAKGAPAAAVIGRIVEKSDGRIFVKKGSDSPNVFVEPAPEASAPGPAAGHGGASCCGGPDSPAGTGGGAEGLPGVEAAAGLPEHFGAFMEAASREGAIPFRSKELTAISLSLLAKCEPCVKLHIDKARSLGVGDAEISEAVWLAVGFGGAPVLMFYNNLKNKL
jgi:selenide,water dikinase